MQTSPASTATSHAGPSAASLRAMGGEYLAFRLGGEEYAVDILRVQEIRSYERPTRMARVPAFVLGVINLRGIIVPVMDLRLRLGLSSPNYDAFTSVIVLNLGDRVVGVVVDSVSDVITLKDEQIRPAPDFTAGPSGQHVTGIGTVEDRMLILVDVAALVDVRQDAQSLH
jgi:purine-binding chemotaxis protein CheW